jgi:hypothetical protein
MIRNSGITKIPLTILDASGSIPEQSLTYLERVAECDGTVLIAGRKWVVTDVDRLGKSLTFADPANLSDRFTWVYQQVIADPTAEPRKILRSMLENPDEREFILSKLKEVKKQAGDYAQTKLIISAIEEAEEKCRREGRPVPTTFDISFETEES